MSLSYSSATPGQPTHAQSAPAASPAPSPTTAPATESRFSRSAEAEITFQEGLLRYTNKQLPEAEEAFKKVIAADPNDSEAWYYLGLAQVDQGKYNDAIDSFDRSLRLDPTRLEVRAARATANIRSGRYDAARDDINKLAPDPRWNSLVHYLRGQIAYAQGALDTAASEFAQAKAAGGTEAEPAGFYQGLTYLRLRELVRARGAFKETEVDPARDPTVAAAARQIDAVLSQQPGNRRPWEAALTLSYVYDSNVIQLGEGSQLPGGISNESDSRIVVQPSGSYSFIRTDKIDAGIEGSGYFAFQFDLNSFDIASYQIGPYVNYRLAENVYASLRYGFNYITLGHDVYLNRNIVTPQLTFVEPKLGYTSIYYQFQERQFADQFAHQFPLASSFDVKDNLDRDGQDHTLGLVQGIKLPELFQGAGDANLELNYRLTDQEAVGSDYDGLFNQVGATLYTPLPFWKLKADVGVSYEYDDYRHANSLDAPTGFAGRHHARKDQQWVTSVGLTRELFKNCSLRVDYNYTTVDSNVQTGDSNIFDYDRHQVGVRLIYTF